MEPTQANVEQTAPVEAASTDTSLPVNQESSDPLAGKSSSDIAKFLEGLTTAQQTTQPQQEVPKQQPTQPVGQPSLNIPDKFKNPDGTVRTDSLLKSYLDAEKALGKYSNVNHENMLLKQELEALKAQSEALPQEDLSQTKYTPEEIELIQKDPATYISKKVEETLAQREAKIQRETQEQRIRDYEILTAINKARETLPEFKTLEPEIEKLANNAFIEPHPDAIPMLYNAVLGSKMPQIADYLQKKSFQEGYEKAKQEFKLQVEGGGKDASPAGLSLNAGNIDKLTSAELEKILPKANDSTTSILY